MRRTSRWVEGVLERRSLVVGLYLALAVAALPGLLRLEVDNSETAFYPRDAPALATLHDLEATFGPTAALRLVLGSEALATAANLERLAALEKAVAAVPGVARVDGPLGHHRRYWSQFGGAIAPEPALFRERLLGPGGALDRAAGLVGHGGRALSLVATFTPATASDFAARRKTVATVERLANELPPEWAAFVAGLPVLERALNEAAAEVAHRFLPLLVAVVFLLLLLTFREAAAVAVPFAFVALVAMPVLGAMGWCGVRLNLVVAILPPVMFAIAIALAVHLLIRCRDLEAGGLDARAATLATYRDKGRAIVWTTASTIAGWSALAVTPIGPIRALGLWGALAMLAIGAAAFTLYPCLLSFTAGRRAALPERRLERALERFGRAVAEHAADRSGRVLLFFALTAFVAALGLPRLKVESNALAYFAADHPLRRQFALAERDGIGLATVELVGTAEDGADLGAWPSAATLARLAALGERLRALPNAIQALTASDLLDDIGRDSPLAAAFPPRELRAALLPLVRADREGGAALARFLASDARRARVTLFVPVAGYETIDPLTNAALTIARAELPDLSWQATGQLPLLLATQHRLLGTLAGSLALAVPALALLFFLLLGEGRGALLALLPNLWPLLMMLGGMGWFGIPLDLATVMVASIVAGLVVDDTIHTLAPYRELRAVVGGRRAVTDRLERTAPAFLITGLVLACGFGVCGLSSFAPLARFGLLAVAAIVIALAADLLLVPALFGGVGGVGGVGDQRRPAARQES